MFVIFVTTQLAYFIFLANGELKGLGDRFIKAIIACF